MASNFQRKASYSGSIIGVTICQVFPLGKKWQDVTGIHLYDSQDLWWCNNHHHLYSHPGWCKGFWFICKCCSCDVWFTFTCLAESTISQRNGKLLRLPHVALIQEREDWLTSGNTLLKANLLAFNLKELTQMVACTTWLILAWVCACCLRFCVYKLFQVHLSSVQMLTLHSTYIYRLTHKLCYNGTIKTWAML